MHVLLKLSMLELLYDHNVNFILYLEGNNNDMVSFLDWGNWTIVRKDDLKDINDDLRYMSSLCC